MCYAKHDQVQDIFRIERDGEKDRFTKSPYAKVKQSDRRLLWHGSRCTNFGGILSQGLRIAPPEAPVSGYMFGKGVYLADISSKSANYCVPSMSGDVGLLLLCEAELGQPMLELLDSDSNAGEVAKAKGCIATWGQGTTAPKGWKDASCLHEELKGVMMVGLPYNAVGPRIVMWLTVASPSPILQTLPDRQAYPGRSSNTTSTSPMTSLSSGCVIFYVLR